MQSGVVTSLYLLCCILRIVKIKDLANTIVAALFYPLETFIKFSRGKVNGYSSDHGFTSVSKEQDDDNIAKCKAEGLTVDVPNSSRSSDLYPESVMEVLLTYVTKGDDVQVLGSLSVLATLLQTKELDESMLDRLGILPQRKQHKKQLLFPKLVNVYELKLEFNKHANKYSLHIPESAKQALVGETSGEEQLFSSENGLMRDSISCEVNVYLEKIKRELGMADHDLKDLPKDHGLFASFSLKDPYVVSFNPPAVLTWLMQLDSHEPITNWPNLINWLMNFKKMKEEQELYGLDFLCTDVLTSPSVPRFQVLDALVSLFCRSNISAETLWDGGWLLRQLLPYSEAEFNHHHLELLQVSYKNSVSALVKEVRGFWPDFLITVLCNEWKKCKRAMESSYPPKEPKCVLFPSQVKSSKEDIPEGSSFAAGERMHELAKVFVVLHQLQIFTLGKPLPEKPLIYPPGDLPVNSRAQASGLDSSGPKPGTEVSLGKCF
ncbi:unnamed protein product [Sphenostylis stenocarpa]|uniref:Uncharacterized protein n=1 Tax=Sphenostylis stenocarpa TaxID=92480 RepID=A0AA86T8D8_9FABA|nr:unnamed protein product [Sphenostylis stenocarpa]